jgi:hypothetical protein
MDRPVNAVIPDPHGVRRCGRSSGVPAPACGSGRRQQLPPRLLDACRFASAVHDQDPFPAANIGFYQGTPIVPRRFLPTHAAMLGNHPQMPVARHGRGLGLRARHRVRPRWHDDRGVGMAGRDLAVDAVPVVCTVAGERRDGTIDLVEQGSACEPSSRSLVVSAAATIRPVSASAPMCSLRHDRRRLVPCFSTNHLPAPHSFNPVLSTNRCTGSALDGGRATASVSPRRLSVEWSGTARSRPSRWMTEPISPSVCRKANRNTVRKVSAVTIARAE